jgi:hypothetical protein
MDVAAVLDLSETPSSCEVKLLAESGDVAIEWGNLRVRFPRVEIGDSNQLTHLRPPLLFAPETG